MSPTIAGADEADDADEPGGRLCYHCRTEIDAGDHVYREVFGKVARTTENGVVFETTGGVPVRHYCDQCFRSQRTRRKAAHYDVTDGDRLWDILEAADGELVADLLPMLVGGRGWIRVVDGDVEARHTVHESTSEGIRFSTEPTEEFGVAKFGEYFDDPGERTRVLLTPVEQTPFVDGDDFQLADPVVLRTRAEIEARLAQIRDFGQADAAPRSLRGEMNALKWVLSPEGVTKQPAPPWRDDE
jgi:hypothetical protein